MNENNNNLLYILLCLILFAGAGCTDAGFQKLAAFGNSHSVKCFSGGTIIYDGTATGKVLSEESSDGYYFKDKETGALMEVSGNCVIKRLD